MKWMENKDVGMLIFRIGIGIMFIFHGWPKITGGPEVWMKVGTSMSHLGINFGAQWWGLAAALAETIGGLLLITGILFRPAVVALFFTMTVATWMKYQTTGIFKEFAWPLEMAIALAAVFFIGSGKHKIRISFK